jgi:hypothetical protein
MSLVRASRVQTTLPARDAVGVSLQTWMQFGLLTIGQ